MLFRAIKYQVDKGPVDAVTGKAKRTLNDSHLLREDVEFQPLTLMALVGPGACGAAGNSEVHRVPTRVLDTDTITQVKEKVLDQIYKGTPFSQRPSVYSLDLGKKASLIPCSHTAPPTLVAVQLLLMRNSGSRLCAYELLWVPPEWRSGLAGHLTLSDEDLTSVTQNHWKRLNTLQHYKVPVGGNKTRWMGQGLPLGSICDLVPHFQVPDGATVVLIPQLHNGGTVSQSLGQTGCPSGESESLGPNISICHEPQHCLGSPGLDSLEPQAGPAEVLATLSASSRFHTPPCQWDRQISRLNQDVEILETWGVRLSKFLSHLSLVPYLLPPCSFLTLSQEKCGLCIWLHVEGRSTRQRTSFCALRHSHAGRW